MSTRPIEHAVSIGHHGRVLVRYRIHVLLFLVSCLVLGGWVHGQTDADLFAAAKGGTVAEVQALINAGANVHARDAYNQTPLMYAAGSNDASVIEALIQAGADVNAVADGDWRALMYAVRDNPDPSAFLALLPLSEDPTGFPLEVYIDKTFDYRINLPTWMPTSPFVEQESMGLILDMPNGLGSLTVRGDPNHSQQSLEEVRDKVLSDYDVTVIGSHNTWFAVAGRRSANSTQMHRSITFMTDSGIVTFRAEYEPEATAFFEAFTRFNANFIRPAGAEEPSAAAPTYAAADFPSDSRITIVTDSLNVRSEPTIQADPVGLQRRGAIATLVSPDPVWNSEYWWWHLEFTDGTSGWSAQGTASEPYLAIATTRASDTTKSQNTNVQNEPTKETAIGNLRGPGFVLEEIRAFWTSEPDVLGGRVLIVPEVRFRVRVEGRNPLTYLQIKAVFYIEDDGALDHLSENTEYIVSSSDIPMQPNTRKQGWITSSRGYVDSGLTALRFLQGNSPDTYIDLYYRFSVFDDWTLLDRITASKKFEL